MNDTIFSLTRYFSPAKIGPFFAVFRGGGKEPRAMPAVTFIFKKKNAKISPSIWMGRRRAGDLPALCAPWRRVFHHPAVVIFFDVMTAAATAAAGRGERWI